MSTRARRRVLAMAGLVTAAGLPLTACALPFDLPGGDASSGPGTSTSAALEHAGRELTRGDAEAALPDYPTGARDTTTTESGIPSDRTTDPEVCLDVLAIGDAAHRVKETETAKANRQWFLVGDPDDLTDDKIMTFLIQSHSQPVGPEMLDDAGRAMTDCSAFAFTGSTGEGSFDDRLLAEPRPAPPLGDQAFAVRTISTDQFKGKSKRVYSDSLTVRIGHNVVTVTRSHMDGSAGFEEIRTAVDDVLARLEEP